MEESEHKSLQGVYGLELALFISLYSCQLFFSKCGEECVWWVPYSKKSLSSDLPKEGRTPKAILQVCPNSEFINLEHMPHTVENATKVLCAHSIKAGRFSGG